MDPQNWMSLLTHDIIEVVSYPFGRGLGMKLHGSSKPPSTKAGNYGLTLYYTLGCVLINTEAQ